VTNALTVDVEDYFHVQAFASVVGRSDWDRYPIRVERNTYRLLELFARKGIRATFFVLGWVAMRCPALVVQISKAGHQVGCHGFSHQAIYSGSEADFRTDLRRAKQVIEDSLGAGIRSYRAPSYSITSKTLWALEVLGEEGFENDSSIFPIVHDRYGIPQAPRFPYVKLLGCGRQLREFPPTTIRMCGVNVPVAGGGYLRLLPYQITAWAIRRVNQIERQPAMVYIHPWELDPDQPRMSASWLSRFRHYQNLDSTETKCIKLLDDFSWAPMEEVLAQRLGLKSFD
jgi:polysaccharide deacetylase family protein (PEP-CTERM system associated)